MLAAADVVICLATDCSHAAYGLAKRYCKAKGKPCMLIAGSSVSALARCVGNEHQLPNSLPEAVKPIHNATIPATRLRSS